MQEITNYVLTNPILIVELLVIAILILLFLVIFVFKRKKDDYIHFEKIEKEEAENEIEALLERMQQDLENDGKDALETFEQEQEEKAIISYKELLAKKDGLKQPVKEVKEDVIEEKSHEFDEPKVNVMTIKNSDENLKESLSVKQEIKDNLKEKVMEDTKKFKNTDFISPIFGKQNSDINYPKVPSFKKNKAVIEIDDGKYDLEKTLNIEPIADEIRKNEEFLKALKEFRNNL